MIVLVAAVLVATDSDAAVATPGDLDTTFSSDGRVTTNFTPGRDWAFALDVQPDGKIVTAGATDYSGDDSRFALARYNPDGTLDTTFSSDGRVTTNFTSGEDLAFAVAVQPDGKIVAAGEVAPIGDDSRFALARYNPDGTLDTTFSSDGRVTTNVTSGEDLAFAVDLQPDGMIVTAGRVGGRGGRIGLARHNPDGSVDTTFGGDGRATINFTIGDDRADDLVIQPTDGKIVVGGTADYFSATARFALARYNTDGTLDTSFSADGRLTTDFTPGFDAAFSVALQPDGRIVAAGQAGGGNAGRVGVARYEINGTPDTTFGEDGRTTTNFTSRLDYADDVIVEPDGKIVAVGATAFYGPDSKFALARYEPDGTLDATFGGDGRVTTNFTSGLDGAFGVAIQPGDAKIVAAGRAGGRFALARYLMA